MLRTDGKSFRPIHPLPILTDTDSNRFLRILTLPIPIPILIHKYHTDTDTDFLKNTDITIPTELRKMVFGSSSAFSRILMVPQNQREFFKIQAALGVVFTINIIEASSLRPPR